MRKKRSQLSGPVLPVIPGQRSGGQCRGACRKSSRMPRAGSMRRTGCIAEMIDSGTIIVRDQELTA